MTTSLTDTIATLDQEYTSTLAQLVVSELERAGVDVPDCPVLSIELDEENPIAPIEFALANEQYGADDTDDYDYFGRPLAVVINRWDHTETFEKVLPMIERLALLNYLEITAY